MSSAATAALLIASLGTVQLEAAVVSPGSPDTLSGDADDVVIPFLGQAPPDEVPVVFQLARTPGYFPTDRIAISRDGREIYFSETTGRDWSRCRVGVSRFEGGRWSGPELLFAGPYFAPALSADEQTLFLDGLGKAYVSMRSAEGWGTPEELPVPVSYLQVAGTGDHYASAAGSTGGMGGFDVVRYIVGPSGPTIESLGPPLNSPGGEGGFSISRDESFVILTAGRGGLARPDLFVSFRTRDAGWTEPVSLGPAINSSSDDYGAYVTSDGRYLFFSRCNGEYTDGDVYWVRIDRLLQRLRSSVPGR
jgi:hypothetical protein